MERFVIPEVWRIPLGIGLCLLAIVLVRWLWDGHVARNIERAARGEPRTSARAHIVQHRPVHHLGALVLFGVGVAILLGAFAAGALILHGGAHFDPRRHIVPPHVLPRGGGGVPADLELALPGVENQGDTNACWAFSTMEAIYGAEHLRSHTMFVASPWRTFWYGTSPNGANDPNTLDASVATVNVRGVEPIGDWPVQGAPDAHDAGVTVPYTGVRLRYVYYGAGYGTSALSAILGELDAHHLVTVLWQVNQSSLRYGVYEQPNTGPFEFYHFVVVYGYVHNANGTVSLAFRNSWGDTWGSHGDGLMPQETALRDLLAAAVIEPGTPAPSALWVPATATAKPKPRASPTATSARACTVHTYHTRVNTNLRDRPALNARALVGAGKGNALRSLCPGDSTEHWLKVQDAQGRHGWVLRSKIA